MVLLTLGLTLLKMKQELIFVLGEVLRILTSPKAVELKTNKTIIALINLEAKLTSLSLSY